MNNSKNFESVSVLSILPFWRYAVGPTSKRSPAIPFYLLASAMAFFDEAKRELPWSGATLYRRKWWKGIEVFKEYVPAAEGSFERVYITRREKSTLISSNDIKF